VIDGGEPTVAFDHIVVPAPDRVGPTLARVTIDVSSLAEVGVVVAIAPFSGSEPIVHALNDAATDTSSPVAIMIYSHHEVYHPCLFGALWFGVAHHQ